MLTRCTLLLALTLTCLLGCGDDDKPGGSGGTGGTGGRAGTGGGGSGGVGGGNVSDCVEIANPTGEPTFDAVFDEVLCANDCSNTFCHGGSATGALRLDQREAAYAALVGTAAAGEECAESGLTRVVPGDADASLLVSKLQPNPPCGSVMPQLADISMPNATTYIPEAQFEQLRAWINAGALRRPPVEMDAGSLDASDGDSGN